MLICLSSSPHCTWIDQDHSEDIQAAVLGITWPGFVTTDNTVPSGDGTDRCGVEMRAWDNEGGAQLLPIAASKRRSQAAPLRRHPADDRLILSSRAAHSATALCQDPMSYGPDFVSLAEGAYCNMLTREVLPLCAAGVGGACFDHEAAQDMFASMATGGAGSQKNVTKVINW
jgi:hypothetical protein